jgi:hypothetical protein
MLSVPTPRDAELHTLLSSAMAADEWLVSRFGHLTPVGISPGFPVECEVGWLPEAVWTFGRKDKSRILAGTRTTNSHMTNPWRNEYRLSYPQLYC